MIVKMDTATPPPMAAPTAPPPPPIKPVPAPETGRQLLDKINYLVSLISDPKGIDVLLDTVRVTMAQWDGESPLPQKDREALEKVIVQLKLYLVRNDPIRDFTLESLEDRLHAKLETATPDSESSLGFLIAVVASVLGGTLVATVLPLGSLYVWAVSAAIISMLFMTILNTWFYLTSLSNFKIELRRVFGYLCVGSIGVGLQFVSFVFITLTHRDMQPLHRYGGLTIYATLALVVIYLGLRKYARLLQLRSATASLWWLAMCGALGLGTASLIASIRGSAQPAYYIFSLTSLVTLSAVALLAMFTAHTISRNITDTYARSMRELMWFCAGVSFGAFGYTCIVVWRGVLYGPALATALTVLATAPVLLLLHSGYSFKRETRR